MESQKSKKEINKDRFKLLSHSPISVKGNQVDGSLKRFPLFFLLLLPPFFLLFVQQSHSLHPQPPDLTYLNPILNLANANVDLFEGVCESFARYSVAETSTGDTSRCIGYLHSPSWSENYVPPRREPHTQTEL